MRGQNDPGAGFCGGYGAKLPYKEIKEDLQRMRDWRGFCGCMGRIPQLPYGASAGGTWSSPAQGGTLLLRILIRERHRWGEDHRGEVTRCTREDGFRTRRTPPAAINCTRWSTVSAAAPTRSSASRGDRIDRHVLQDRLRAEGRLRLREVGTQERRQGPVRKTVHDCESSTARSCGLHDMIPAAWMRRPFSAVLDRMA